MLSSPIQVREEPKETGENLVSVKEEGKAFPVL